MRNIAVFTGTRAEYSLLYYLLKFLQQDSNINLQLFVGGTHLSYKYGYTIEQIIDDGFTVTEKLDFLASKNRVNDISESLSLAISLSSYAITKHSPDIIVLLGDRYEALGIAQAAMINRVPIAHIHGGEITEGAIDDVIRHAITKMSHIHFTATEAYRNRVIQLGELPDRVFNVGAPGIDSIKRIKLLSRNEIQNVFNDKLNKPFFLVTYHPVTLSNSGMVDDLKCLLSVLRTFEDYQIILTYPNADDFGQEIINYIEKYAQEQPDQVFLVKSLGQLRYLSAMKHAEAVIGNTSSGIIEAPSFNVPTVNIGDRQKGRLASNSVIQCPADAENITKAINKALSKEFKNSLKFERNPYGNGGASEQIYRKLKNFNLKNIIQKKFFNIPVN